MGSYNDTESEHPSRAVITLVSSPYNSSDFLGREDVAYDDLGLGYLYTILKKQGFQVGHFDPMKTNVLFGSPYEAIVHEVEAEGADYLILFDTIFTFRMSLDFSRKLKEQSPGIAIIYCSLHASLYHEDILSAESHVDFIVCGDAEVTVPLLIECLENENNPCGIPGLAYGEAGRVKMTPPEFRKDLDFLPLPYRPALVDADPGKRLFYNIISSRGCPGHCTYCVTSSYLNRFCPHRSRRWRFRSPKHVVDEIQYLYDQGVRRFAFTDENWIGNREDGLARAMEICELIIDHRFDGISLAAMFRPDSLRHDDKILPVLKRAGFRVLSMGLEAAHPEQLKQYGKKVECDHVKALVDTLFDLGIIVRCGFIMFFPYSTFEMLRHNARFLEDIGLTYMFISYVSVLSAQSATSIEKKLLGDNLVIKPTTYHSPGEYRFVDQRVEAFHGFLKWLLSSERDTFHTFLIAAFEAGRFSGKHKHCLNTVHESLTRIGRVSTDMFNYSLTTYETGINSAESFRKCYQYSYKWSEAINQEKALLTSLIQETLKL